MTSTSFSLLRPPAATGDWVSTWIRLTAERLLSYADENTQP